MGLGLAATMLASACRCGSEGGEQGVKEARNGAAGEVEYRALEVEFTGCAASTRVPLSCGLEDRKQTLKLWVGTTHEPTVLLDGEELALSREPVEVDGGKLVRVQVSGGAKELVVETGPSSRPGRWSLRLDRVEPTPGVDRVRKGVLDEKTSQAEFETLLDELTTIAKTASPRERIHARRLRLLLRRGSTDPAKELEAGRKVMEEALELGLYTEAVDLAQILAYDAGRMDKEGEAQEILDVQEAYLPTLGDARWRALSHYHQGALAFRGYDYGRSLTELTSAIALFRKLGMASDERSALPLAMTPLAVAGRSQELDASATRLIQLVEGGAPDERCDDVLNLNNAAWAIVVEATGDAAVASAASLVERALELDTVEGCSSAGRPEWETNRADTLLTGAMIGLEQGDLGAVDSYLAQLRKVKAEPLQEAWRLFLDGVYADANGTPARARDALVALESLDYGSADPLLEWRVATLRGNVEEALGNDPAALEHYLRGEEALAGFAKVVGVGQGREGLLSESMASSIGAIRVLMRSGDRRKAAEVAARSRSRAVALVAAGPVAGTLSQSDRRRWAQHMQRYREGLARLEAIVGQEELASREEVAALRAEARQVRLAMKEEMDAAQSVAASEQAAEPAKVADGECVLRFHPSADGWTVFAIDAEAVEAESIGAVEEGSNARRSVEQLLVRFDEQISRATTVVVEPLGLFSDVDVHEASWRGQPLLAKKRVEYSLGLSTPSPAKAGMPKQALVVGDPVSRGEGRLRGALREVEVVTSALQDAGIQHRLLTAEDAGRIAVFEALEGADWFHFSGHGASAGTAGWESRIATAEGQGLEVRDILALRKGPRNVVLMGCETGQLASGSGVGMHLASAFVLAGADRVIAATKEIPDQVALQFSEALYRSGGPANWDLSEMWRVAAIASRASGEGTLGLRVWRR